MANPTLVQHTVTPSTIGHALASSSYILVNLPNPVLSGNLVIVAVSYNSAGTCTVTDDQAQTYTAITNDSAGQRCKLFYILGSAAGVKQIEVHLTASYSWIQVAVAEFYNVATSSADVTSATGAATSASWAATTATLAGNATAELPYLVFQVGCAASNVAQSSFTPASGFELGCALLQRTEDTTGTGNGSAPIATQFKTVTSSVTNPTITAGVSAAYASIAVAFKSAAAGTAPSLSPRVQRVQYCEFDTASPVALQFPGTGTLFVAVCLGNQGSVTTVFTGFTDTGDNAWNEIDNSPVEYSSAGNHQMFYAESPTTSNTLIVSAAYTGTIEGSEVVFFDIVGADSYVAGSGRNASGDKGTSGNLTTVSITPSAAGNILIAHTDHTEGTEFGCVQDANGHTPTFMTPYWNDENGTAISYYCHDSGQANFRTTDTNAVTFIYNRSATAPGAWVGLTAEFGESSSPIECNLVTDSLNGGTVRFG